jgi:predicted RNA-binding protein (virulence factor B family)
MGLQKKIQLLFIALVTVTFVNAQNKPASPAATATGKINGATISINYSSPSVKGRVIWGELVPFNKIWRAGANAATTIETDKDLVVEGEKLPAGKYSFFVIPNEKECVIIFNKVAKMSGTNNYDEKEDQLRVTVKQQMADSSTESLVYNINKNSIVLSWEKWNIPVSVK